MPWKMDGEHIALKDGNPVWENDGGTEIAVDYAALSSKLTDTTKESVKRKETIRELNEKLTVFEGIDDPAKFLADAKKAMDTVKNLDDKKLIDAGEAEKIKAEVTKAMQVKLDEAIKRADDADATLQQEMIGGRFARSKFIADKVAVPADMIQAVFGRHFSIKDGKVVGKGHDGQELYSKDKPGELADFDEALSILVDGYSNKAAILKGSEASGSGTQPGGGGNPHNTKTISRAAFDVMEQSDRAKFFKDGGKVQEQ